MKLAVCVFIHRKTNLPVTTPTRASAEEGKFDQWGTAANLGLPASRAGDASLMHAETGSGEKWNLRSSSLLTAPQVYASRTHLSATRAVQ